MTSLSSFSQPMLMSRVRFLCLVTGLVVLWAVDVSADVPRPISQSIRESAVPLPSIPEAVFEMRSTDAVMTASVNAAAFELTSSGDITLCNANDLSGQQVTSTTPLPSQVASKSSVFRLAELAGPPGEPGVIDRLLPRLAGMTVFVVMTCAATLWLARRWLSARPFTSAQRETSRLMIADTLAVSPQCRVHILTVDDREFLMTITSQGLQQVLPLPSSFSTLMETSERPSHLDV